MAYRVSLDIFDGPLDLLLHLIRRRELDVCDVALQEVTESYLEHVEVLRLSNALDLDGVGDFLVVAATLVEIKSNRLLPQPERRRIERGDGDQIDPRLELVRQLVEYKRYKDAAAELEARREVASLQHPRVPAKREDDETEPPPIELEELHAWDLLSIFERLMDEVGRNRPRGHEVQDDDTPLALHAADLADRVERDGRVSFRDLLIACETRRDMIGIFLALLELVRQKRVLLEPNEEDSNDLILVNAPPEHRARYVEALSDTELEETL